MKEKVFFFGRDAKKIAGEIYIPEDNGRNLAKYPGIILCQGLSGLKEKVLPDIAEIFSGAGYTVLAFDYRGCGESEDARKRPYLFPFERADDVSSAISFMRTLSFVDKDKIGLYGISYGGAIAPYVASYDKRIKCIVAVSGPGNGEIFMSSLRSQSDWGKFLRKLEADRIKRVKDGISAMVPFEEVIPFPETFRKKYKNLENLDENESKPETTYSDAPPMLSLESADAMRRFRPDAVVHLVSPTPILFIHGESDDVVPVKLAKDMYRKAKKTRKFISLPDMDHIDLDTGEGLYRQIRLSLKWFDTYLDDIKK